MSASEEMSPKARVSYDQHAFTVEFDVSEYSPEELSIKTEGDVLVVLAKHETKAEGGQSFVSQQFEQRFSLPSGVRADRISSKLSKEGVLTVTAPRDTALAGRKGGGALEQSPGVFSQSEETRQQDGLPHPKVSYDDDKFQISLDAKDYKPEDLDVKVEGNTIIITAKQELEEAGGTRTRVFEQKFSLPSGVAAELVRSSLSRQGVLTITAPRGQAARQAQYSETIESKADRVLDPKTWEKEKKPQTVIEEKKKETFFDDVRRDSEERRKDFFDDFQKDSLFSDKRRESALSNPRHASIFDKERSSLFDDKNLSIFDKERSSLFDDRSLFATNSDQNGVSKVQYDEENYKILINVDKYKPEHIQIKTVDNTVVVEAKNEEKTSDGRSFATQSFNQSFTLPRGVNPEQVTSALSREGVLTISAPLPRPVKSAPGERLVPIKHS